MERRDPRFKRVLLTEEMGFAGGSPAGEPTAEASVVDRHPNSSPSSHAGEEARRGTVLIAAEL